MASATSNLWALQFQEGKEGKTGATGPTGEFNFRGAWSSATTYAKGDATEEGGSTYASLKATNKNHKPSELGEWWSLVAKAGEGGGGGGVTEPAKEKNTVAGHEALSKTVTSTSNTAYGYRALRSTETGSENTGIGVEALEKNTGVGTNTAVGFQAAKNTTIGDENTAVGARALIANEIGAANTAIGFEAQISGNKEAEENTSVGVHTLEKNKEGSRNTVVGMNALRETLKSEHNTAVGWGTGLKNKGNASVFIGYEAGRNEEGSNKLYIANSSTETPLILGDFSAPSLTLLSGGGTFRIFDKESGSKRKSVTGVTVTPKELAEILGEFGFVTVV
jgi:hypothetical protein